METNIDVREATHVKLKDGTVERIVEKWGIDPEGRLARPSAGGFGVITDTGRRVDMWQAYAYYKFEPCEHGRDESKCNLCRLKASESLRYTLLTRLYELFTTRLNDMFERHGVWYEKFYGMQRRHQPPVDTVVQKTMDFLSAQSDEVLVNEFERCVMRAYRQRG